MTRPANPQLRRQILAEAEDLLAHAPPGEFNLRDLARRVGVSATAIYTYFANKGELLAEVRLRVAERLNDRVRDIDPALPPHEALKVLGERYIAFAEENPLLYTFMTEGLSAPPGEVTGHGSRAPRPDELPVLYFTYYQARSYLEALAKDPTCPPQPPPAVGATIGWIMLHGFCSLLIAGRLELAEGMTRDQLRGMFLSLYGAPAPGR